MSAGFPGAGTLVRFPFQSSIRQSPSRLLRPSIGRGNLAALPRTKSRKGLSAVPPCFAPPLRGTPRNFAVLRAVSRYSVERWRSFLCSLTWSHRRRLLNGAEAAVFRAAAREWFSAIHCQAPLTRCAESRGTPRKDALSLDLISSLTLLRRSLFESIQRKCIGCQGPCGQD